MNKVKSMTEKESNIADEWFLKTYGDPTDKENGIFYPYSIYAYVEGMRKNKKSDDIREVECCAYCVHCEVVFDASLELDDEYCMDEFCNKHGTIISHCTSITSYQKVCNHFKKKPIKKTVIDPESAKTLWISGKEYCRLNWAVYNSQKQSEADS